MFLFIAMAMTATIGTVIQQGERPETYIQEYGEEAYRWFVRLGFIDVYHTLVVHESAGAPLREFSHVLL